MQFYMYATHDNISPYIFSLMTFNCTLTTHIVVQCHGVLSGHHGDRTKLCNSSECAITRSPPLGQTPKAISIKDNKKWQLWIVIFNWGNCPIVPALELKQETELNDSNMCTRTYSGEDWLTIAHDRTFTEISLEDGTCISSPSSSSSASSLLWPSKICIEVSEICVKLGWKVWWKCLVSLCNYPVKITTLGFRTFRKWART